MIIIRRKIIKRRKDSWNHHLFFNRKKTSPIASPQVWMKIRGRSEFNLTIRKRQTKDGGVFGGRSVGSYWRRILESQPRWDGDFFVSLSILHSMSFLFTYLMVFLRTLVPFNVLFCCYYCFPPVVSIFAASKRKKKIQKKPAESSTPTLKRNREDVHARRSKRRKTTK